MNLSKREESRRLMRAVRTLLFSMARCPAVTVVAAGRMVLRTSCSHTSHVIPCGMSKDKGDCGCISLCVEACLRTAAALQWVEQTMQALPKACTFDLSFLLGACPDLKEDRHPATPCCICC